MSISSDRGPHGPRKILVAVDFGTTYSGLAWTQTESPTSHFVINAWPDQTLTDDKVPTTLVYDENDDSKYRWGSQIEEMEPKHEWFKLSLDPAREGGNSDLARRYPSSLPSPPGYVAKRKLVTDYLTALRKHTENILERKLSRKIASRTPKEYILTVPAVWSPRARDATLSCARDAGMGSKDSIHMITEPEAAALYELNERTHLGLNVGDTFVVCDAGGGTVDLISYTIADLKPTILHEAASGSGQACGSIFLNRIFAKYLRDRFENDPRWDDEILLEAMKRFETDIKRKFHEGRPGPYYIPVYSLRDNPRQGIQRGRLRLTKDDIKDIFEPVITEIVLLVKNQIRATGGRVKAVLLVGGFGQNVYLRNRLKAEVGDDISVQESLEPWTAVVRGALIRGLAEVSPTLATTRVPSRVARKHIGAHVFVPFDESIHDRSRRQSSSFLGRYHILVMNWLIKKGENVKESVPCLIPYYWEQKKYLGPPTVIRMLVFDCSDENAPLYKTNNVKDLVEVKANLTSIPENEFDQEPGADNEIYYKVNFDIEMTCYSARTVFALRYKGKKYDTVTADYV